MESCLGTARSTPSLGDQPQNRNSPQVHRVIHALSPFDHVSRDANQNEVIMNAESTTARQGITTNALAILSVATFWAIPFAPFIAMAALHRTKSTTGWARRLSVVAAVLCSVHTLALAAAICCLIFLILTDRIHS